MSATIEMALAKGDANVVAVLDFLSGIGENQIQIRNQRKFGIKAIE